MLRQNHSVMIPEHYHQASVRNQNPYFRPC